MKQIFIWIIICSGLNAYSQEYYSVISPSEDFLSLQINAVAFNGKQYVIDEEYCTTFGPGCTIISEVLPNGTLNKVREVEDFSIRYNAALADTGTLTIIGSNHNDSINILQFDTAFNEINRRSIYQENHNWTFGIFEFDSYLVISSRNLEGADYFQSFLYWISKSDLAMVDTMEGAAYRNIHMIEMKVDPDNLLHIFTWKKDSIHILQYNSTRDLTGVIQTPSDSFIQSANFEILSNHNMVYGLDSNAYLICINPSGDLVWKFNLAAEFGVSVIQFIQEIVEASNGDILVCGMIYPNRNAFIARITNTGEVLWNRIYEIGIAKESFLMDILEMPDSKLLFTGSVKMVEPSQSSAHDNYWTLLTDADGCIDASCIMSNDQIRNVDGSFNLFPNPATRYIQVNATGHIQLSNYKVIDQAGRQLLHGDTSNQIDLGTLSPGLYFFLIQDDISKNWFSFKVLKVE